MASLSSGKCKTCRDLLSAGLDLCVRARDMDAIDRRAAALSASVDGEAWQQSGRFDAYVERHNATPEYYHQPISTKSATMPLWFKDQYERDLADWEQKARTHLMKGCEA